MTLFSDKKTTNMKRTIFTLLFVLLGGFGVYAQTPQDEVSLTDMTFVRQSFIRNFYNLRKVVSQINMEGTNLQLASAANLIVENDKSAATLKQEGRTLNISASEGDVASTIRVGAFHPYFTYEVSVADIDAGEQAGINFYPNSGEGKQIRIVYHDGRVQSLAVDGGSTTVLAEKEVKAADMIKLRVQYTGVRFHVFTLHDDGSTNLLYSVKNDMRAVESCVTHSFGVFASLQKGGNVTLHKAEAMLTCGTGQADSQIIQYSDGTPLIKDGRSLQRGALRHPGGTYASGTFRAVWPCAQGRDGAHRRCGHGGTFEWSAARHTRYAPLGLLCRGVPPRAHSQEPRRCDVAPHDTPRRGVAECRLHRAAARRV